MARENWAQHYSNEEKVIFEKGVWTLTEDGEKTWSLYNKGACVSPVVEYNKYNLFSGGFLLYTQGRETNSFALFSSNEDKPVYKFSGENCYFEIDNDLIIFNDGTTFETEHLTKISLNDENQLSFDI